jgi:hemoglobin
MSEQSLYERLGGYDGISGFVDNLLPRLQEDELLGRFWQNRGSDGIAREKQLLIDYLCTNAGGSMVYTGREMKLSHVGMGITENDWDTFISHAVVTMEALQVPKQECDDIAGFVLSLRDDIIDS